MTGGGVDAHTTAAAVPQARLQNLSVDGGGCCPEHVAWVDETQVQARHARDRGRGSTAQRGYGAAWQRLRRRKLRRDPLCATCGRAAEVVHHRDEDARHHAENNLVSLCRACHERLHGRLRDPRRYTC